MSKNRTRLTAIAGTTMALALAGTAAVSAAGPRDQDEMRGSGGWGMRPGSHGMRGDFGGLRGLDSDVERTERTVQTADGTTSTRVEQGVADSASDTSLSFSLGSGESVTVVIDEDTQIYALEESEFTSRRGGTFTRLVPTEVAAADITAGADVVVWSDSEDGADFVASRVVIEPAATAEDTTDADASAEPATDDAAAVEDTTQDTSATDA
jgi:hypothetical protein